MEKYNKDQIQILKIKRKEKKSHYTITTTKHSVSKEITSKSQHISDHIRPLDSFGVFFFVFFMISSKS